MLEHYHSQSLNIGAPEFIVILLIVVILFGGGRVAKLGGELGTAMRDFRRGLRGEDAVEDKKSDTSQS